MQCFHKPQDISLQQVVDGRTRPCFQRTLVKEGRGRLGFVPAIMIQICRPISKLTFDARFDSLFCRIFPQQSELLKYVVINFGFKLEILSLEVLL